MKKSLFWLEVQGNTVHNDGGERKDVTSGTILGTNQEAERGKPGFAWLFSYFYEVSDFH